MQHELVLPEPPQVYYAFSYKLNFSCYSGPFPVNPLVTLPIVPETILEYEEGCVVGVRGHFMCG